MISIACLAIIVCSILITHKVWGMASASAPTVGDQTSSPQAPTQVAPVPATPAPPVQQDDGTKQEVADLSNQVKVLSDQVNTQQDAMIKLGNCMGGLLTKEVNLETQMSKQSALTSAPQVATDSQSPTPVQVNPSPAPLAPPPDDTSSNIPDPGVIADQSQSVVHRDHLRSQVPTWKPRLPVDITVMHLNKNHQPQFDDPIYVSINGSPWAPAAQVQMTPGQTFCNGMFTVGDDGIVHRNTSGQQ